MSNSGLPAQNALSAADIMQRLEAWLTPLVTGQMKGVLSVARDPLEVVEQLSLAPGSFRVILNWAGETPTPGTHKTTGIVDHEIHVTVSQNRGLQVYSGSNLWQRGAQTQPLMVLVAQVREKIRQLTFPDGVTDRFFTYGGCSMVAADNRNLDAFTLLWKLTATLPPAITTLT